MNILCLICSELLRNEDDMVSTPCGHVFHRGCVVSWLNSATTCPTCRNSPLTPVNLIKLFLEFDDNKANLNMEDILKTNDELTQSLAKAKEQFTREETLSKESQDKLKAALERNVRLTRQKQLDDMAIAGFKSVKEDSMKEIVKLNEYISTLKYDLLAEKQLRRMMQAKLHDLQPDDENYDITSIRKEDQSLLNGHAEGSSMDVNISEIGSFSSFKQPFWKLSCEAAIANKGSKETQKPSEKLAALRNQRSLWKSEKKPIGFNFKPTSESSPSQPSTSSHLFGNSQKRTFGEGMTLTSPIRIPSSRDTIFNFSIENTPSFSSSTPPFQSNIVSPLRSYRDSRENSESPSPRGAVGPKASER